MTAVSPVLDLIDGELSAPSVALDTMLEDPNTGEPLQPMVASDDDKVERALSAADRVHVAGEWERTTVEERAAWLERLAAALQPMAADVAAQEALTTGVPISQTTPLSFILHAAFALAAQQLREGVLLRHHRGAGGDIEVYQRPLGVAVALVPWNAPAPMAAHKVASALAAGAPVICKPSELAPNGCSAIARAAVDVGLPHGVLQLVHGGPQVGARLVADRRVRAVSFTGGLAGGRAIAQACAADLKPAQLELGGNNPLLVADDASAVQTARAATDLLTSLNGQWCRALGRLLLPARRADELLDAVLERLATVRSGSSLEATTEFGPIIHSRHLARLRAQRDGLVSAGATVHSRTQVPERGNFLAPTLLTGVDPQRAQDEIFGPVATVHTYADDDEAVALANGTPFGLEAYVVAGDEEHGLRLARGIRAGEVKVNGSSVLSLDLMTPRPAWGLSGLGVEGTVETITFFTGQQVVGVEVAAVPA